jgi:predicted ATPase
MKHYLKAIQFSKEFRKIFKVGDEVNFFPGITLLVGDQGSGKSSVLSCILGKNREKAIKPIWGEDGGNSKGLGVASFDFEHDNPRIKGHFPLNATGNQMAFQIGVKWQSHGETNLMLSRGMLGKDLPKDSSIICLDEPESGLSVRSQYKVWDFLSKAAESGKQLIIATHSTILIEQASKVFSMEHRQEMTAAEFLKTQQP